jgi:hypothetical protein
MLDTDFIDYTYVKNAIRDYYGTAEIRVNKTCVTITLRDPFSSLENIEASANFCLRLAKLDSLFTVQAVSESRFKLVTKTAPVQVVDFPDIDFAELDEDDSDLTPEEYKKLTGAIEATVAAAHKQSQLEILLTEQLDYEIEEFITANLSAALELMPTDDSECIEDIKKVMAFSYLTGKWSNARMQDLDFLMGYFNNKYQFQAEQFGNG